MKPQTSFSHTPLEWINVYKTKQSCPVCGKRDNCEVTRDGRAAYCRRIRSAKQGRDGGWFHWLLDTPADKPQMPANPRKEKPQAKRAQAEKLNKVYSAMLELFTLEEKHRSDLLKRGLSYQAIEANNYKSTPSLFDASQIADELSHKFDLYGLPGFFLSYGTWRMVSVREGFFVPIRNTQGQIHGLQIRLDNPINGKQKYCWFSSGNFYKGASSSSPVHFSKPDSIHKHNEVLITEGALKADIISYLTNAPVIAFAGVSNFGANFSIHLRKRFPSLRKTILCFDSDRYEKKQVRDPMFKLGNELRRAYFDVSVRDWSDEFKGYDDFLVAQTNNTREVSK